MHHPEQGKFFHGGKGSGKKPHQFLDKAREMGEELILIGVVDRD